MSITEIAIKRPLLIIVLFFVLVLFGIQSYYQLNYNLLPKINVKSITISTIYPGASAAEVESSVTKKLEDAFASVEGLDKITSTSRAGVSQIVVKLISTADVIEAERNIQRKADQMQNELPTDTYKPLVKRINLEEVPVISAGLTAKLAPKALYDLVDKQLRPILQNVVGVGQVNVLGGEKREIQVNIDLKKMVAYQIGIEEITDAVTNANQSFPAGSIETENNQLSIRYDANVTSLQQIKTIIVKQNKGSSIYLKDVAEVIDATAKIKTINHMNGVPSVGIQIIKQSDANAVEVSRLITEVFEKLKKQYAKDNLQFSVSSDQSVFTMKTADAVKEDLLIAVFIVGLVMLAFLHSLRSSLFVLVALPCSIIPTFIAVYFFGFSLNLMTLMAMSLVVGILVDDSIVVLENIYRHLEMGADRKKAALDGRNEIGFTALAITLVDIVVFLPLALTSGTIGSILKEFSMVVVISTLMSLLVSFTITPMLASRFGRIEQLSKDTWWGRLNLTIEGYIEALKQEYSRLLEVALQKKRYLFAGVLILITSVFLLLSNGFIGANFIPSGDRGELVINLETDPTATIYQTNMIAQQVEAIILARPEVTNVFSGIGVASGAAQGAGNNNLSELTVSLKDKKDRRLSTEEFGTLIQQEISKAVPGLKTTATPTEIAGNGNDAPIQIAIKGLDLAAVRKIAERYQQLIATVPGTQFVQLSVKDRYQEVEVSLNRERMSVMGLNARLVGSVLQNAFNGNDKNIFKELGNEYDIKIGMDNHNRSTINDVKNLTFKNESGKTFSLDQFADVHYGLAESMLQRTDRLASITVNSNVTGRPTGSVADDIKAKLKQIKIPDGITIEYLGDVKKQGDAFTSLGIALATGILLIYLIMVALYESLIYPFVVLFSIPVALIGALLALALTMETLNIFSIVGMIMLLGLVSKNAILIVDFSNQLIAEGKPTKQALLEAGKERLRPILMTTIAMILGMLPIALASGAGSEIKNGMAWVIIGGLTSSMVLTLFVVPSIYLIVHNLKSKLGKKAGTDRSIVRVQLNPE
ncbi:MAG: efflux RND transporter permease subunit [Chryseobacterium sp.]|nr:MAG: efflux RND transporter permease subunit [Chryseobacterium sp.]